MTCKTVLKTTALAAVMASASAFSAQAVFFHIGSGSIDGSLCVGNDCVASPAFGFDTVILRENNLRMLFDDTSTTASFPPNDWRLTANDSANGGSSHFSIEDASAGRFVFRVFAGARSNALVVDSQGDLGLGTTTPATDIDIKIGDTPTVRLQQDGTSGFTPQTWDMAGNETNFFIRDATGGSTLPFRIRPTAPSNSIYIDPDGNTGFGTASPSDSDGLAERFIEVKNGTDVRVVLDSGSDETDFGEVLFQRDNANEYSFGYDANRFYIFAYNAPPGDQIVLTVDRATGNLTVNNDLQVNGDIDCTGSINGVAC